MVQALKYLDTHGDCDLLFIIAVISTPSLLLVWGEGVSGEWCFIDKHIMLCGTVLLYLLTQFIGFLRLMVQYN